MNNGGLKIWRQALVFHLSHLIKLLPIYPLLFIPVVGDGLTTILITQKIKENNVRPFQAVREVWQYIPMIFNIKIYYETAALLWGFIPIYGIIKYIDYRSCWAMASNVLIIEKASGDNGRKRCEQLALGEARGFAARTLIIIPSLLFFITIFFWCLSFCVFETFSRFRLLFLLIISLWLIFPCAGTVNTYLYYHIQKYVPNDKKS